MLDPHSAVALAAVDAVKEELKPGAIICLATAHPAKFPQILQPLFDHGALSDAARHFSIEKAKHSCQKVYLCDHSHLEEALSNAMEKHWDLNIASKT